MGEVLAQVDKRKRNEERKSFLTADFTVSEDR